MVCILLYTSVQKRTVSIPRGTRRVTAAQKLANEPTERVRRSIILYLHILRYTRSDRFSFFAFWITRFDKIARKTHRLIGNKTGEMDELHLDLIESIILKTQSAS